MSEIAGATVQAMRPCARQTRLTLFQRGTPNIEAYGAISSPDEEIR
jgi:hypothetical protein